MLSINLVQPARRLSSLCSTLARTELHADDFIAALYLALIVCTPWLVRAGPQVVPPAELATLAPPAALSPIATFVR
jgi:hypothetical protein